MFQDIAPHTFTNEFAWLEPEPDDRVLIYADDKVLVRTSDAGEGAPVLEYPRVADIAPDGLSASSAYIEEYDGELVEVAGTYLAKGHASIYLFSVDSTAYFFAEVSQNRIAELLAEDWRYVSVGRLKDFAPKEQVFAGIAGLEFRSWYDTRRFCGRCGGRMMHDLVERALRCPACGLSDYPKLFPAVIVAVVNPENGKVLVSRYAGREYTRYALIAGFADMGESIEQTVHREVMEEVGLKVRNLRFYRSQPWPFSSSVLMGFFCELDGDDTITLDTHELEYATWLDPADLPAEDADYSLTREMMGVLREEALHNA